MMKQEEFRRLLDNFTQGVGTGDAALFRSCFTQDAVYHDYIYGKHSGHAGIDEMLGLFMRDAKDYLWEMKDAVCNAEVGYAYWLLSYVPTLAKYESKRIVLEGTSRFYFRDGLIAHYGETTSGGIAMVQLGVDAARVEKVLKRSAADLRSSEAAARHLNHRVS